MGAFILAWLTGEAIICYRSVAIQGGPPWPGQLLAGTGAFAVLALIAEAGPEARKLALSVAWALNAGAFLALFPESPAIMGNTMGTVTGTDQRNKGWWANATASRVSNTSVLPGAGGCGPDAAGGGGGGGVGAGCPPGYTKIAGICLPYLFLGYQSPPAPGNAVPLPGQQQPGTQVA